MRRLTGAAVVGGAGAVALGASPAMCESSRQWYGDPFSWDSPLSSFLFEPFGLAQHERARLLALDRPGVQVTEAADGYEFSVALPGVRPADLDVTVEGGVLLLKGTARHGSFERRLRQLCIARSLEGLAAAQKAAAAAPPLTSEEADVVEVEAEVELVEAEEAADVQWAVVEGLEVVEVMAHEAVVDEGGRSEGRPKRRRNAGNC